MELEAVSNPDEALLRKLEALWERSVRATHAFLDEAALQAIRPEVRQGLEQVRLTIAREGDVVLGFSGTSGDTLEMLFVDAPARGKGAGRALLEKALAEGVQALDVNEQNPQAREFYEHHGFRPVGRSAVDGQGRPYPLLHMRREGRKEGVRGHLADA